jgi:hypothetical protein
MSMTVRRWARVFAASGHAPGMPRSKDSLGWQSIAALVERRLRAVPMLHAAIEQDPSFTLTVARARPHTRDSHGRNWDIVAFQTAFHHWPQGHIEFRAIVDELRAAYDLA